MLVRAQNFYATLVLSLHTRTMCGKPLRGQPGACLLEFVRPKEFYRCPTNAGARKTKGIHFPSRVRHNGDPGNFVAVRKQKIQVIPIRSSLPPLEIVLENSEQAR